MPLSSRTSQPPPPVFLSHSSDNLLFDYFFTMEFPPDNNFQSGQSPRRQQLQGPRPAPLKVRKDSHKIRKPPVPVPPQYPSSQPQAPPRPPVIIYTVSPKVIHANPSEFMTLVQRLTGPPDHHHHRSGAGGTCSSSTSSSSAAVSTSTSSTSDMAGGAIILSPAARFASLEKINNNRSSELMKKKKIPYEQQQYDDFSVVGGIEINSDVERTTGYFPTGILSPNPASLAPIPPNFFSPPSADPNPLGFFYDLSPVLHSSHRNYLETASFVLPSPSTFISPRNFGGSPSTSPSLDLFNNFFDL